MILFPEAAPGVRGAYNFKKSRGRGYIRLKCEDEVRGFTPFNLAVGVVQDSVRVGVYSVRKDDDLWMCLWMCGYLFDKPSQNSWQIQQLGGYPEVNATTLATIKLSMGEESRGPVKHDFAHSVAWRDQSLEMEVKGSNCSRMLSKTIKNSHLWWPGDGRSY